MKFPAKYYSIVVKIAWVENAVIPCRRLKIKLPCFRYPHVNFVIIVRLLVFPERALICADSVHCSEHYWTAGLAHKSDFEVWVGHLVWSQEFWIPSQIPSPPEENSCPPSRAPFHRPVPGDAEGTWGQTFCPLNHREIGVGCQPCASAAFVVSNTDNITYWSGVKQQCHPCPFIQGVL